MSNNVAVIGLGAMGLPMAQRLAEKFPLTVFDIEPTPLREMESHGARAEKTVAAAVNDADVTVLVVRDAAQIDAVLFGESGAQLHLKAGSAVIITSTVGEEPLRAAEKKLAPYDVNVIDAALSGGPVRARTGELLLMVGGPVHEGGLVSQVLHHLASDLCIVGDRAGQGQQLKTVNQLLCGIHTAAAAEALALAQKLGLDLDMVIDVLGTGAAASFMLSDRGPRIAQQLRHETPPLRSRLDVIGKDMRIVGNETSSSRVSTPLAAAAEQLYQIGESLGLGGQDDSVIATILTAE